MPKPILMATHRTLDQIPAYLRGSLDTRAIDAGATVVIDIGQTVRVTAIDAEGHWPGAVNYHIEFPGSFRAAAMFDRRSWSDLDTSVAEGCDIGVFPANSVLPAPASGHVDLHATLAMLTSLKRPPRCSLLMHFNQHEGQNDMANSMGSLISHTHALAPHLAVRWAYPGMVVSSRALPPRNPVMLLDPETNIPCGVAEKSEAHKRRLLHASVIMLVATGQGELLLYRRHPRQSYANRLDTFGGHVQPGDGPDPLNAAVREFNEEVRMFVSGRRVAAHASFLNLVGKPYSLLADEEENLERSSLVAARIPAAFEIKAFDETDTGEEVELQTERRLLGELLAMYARDPAMFADGLGRVLQAACRDEHFRDSLRAVLE